MTARTAEGHKKVEAPLEGGPTERRKVPERRIVISCPGSLSASLLIVDPREGPRTALFSDSLMEKQKQVPPVS